VLMENRSGLVVDAELTRASGHAERLASTTPAAQFFNEEASRPIR
jgi:hypothetical protein